MYIAILCISAVAICTERVEAKVKSAHSAAERCCCNLHGACGGKVDCTGNHQRRGIGCNLHGACGGKGRWSTDRIVKKWLQSARSVWRQRPVLGIPQLACNVAICTERVEAKFFGECVHLRFPVAICTERVEAKSQSCFSTMLHLLLQSARSVWRQSFFIAKQKKCAICCNLHGACGGKACCSRLRAVYPCCNLHGACGGKV